MKKRLFDIVFSLVGLVVFAPIFFIAFLTKIKTGRSPFTADTVYGKDFRLFRCYRFDTAPNLPACDGQEVQKERAPLSDLWHNLRLEGLPQLVNVLKGEMSVVGPCPEDPRNVEAFRADFETIMRACPGMVDLASIIPEEKSPVLKNDPEELHPAQLLKRIKLAKEYLFHQTFTLDLRILIVAIVNSILSWSFPFHVRRQEMTVHDALTQYRHQIVFILHIGAAAVSNYFAFALRYEGNIPEPVFTLFAKTVPLLVGLRLAAIYLFGLHVKLWRYVGAMDMANIGAATLLSSFWLWVAIKLIPLAGYSRSVIVVDAVSFFVILAVLRGTKTIYKRVTRVTTGARKVLIIGAGNAGAMIAHDLQQNPSYNRIPIAFVDDDPHKQHAKIHGVPVVGTSRMLDAIVKNVFAEEIVIALPSASPSQVKPILTRCKPLGLPIKWVPNLPALLNGQVSISDLRPLDIEDLVGRPEITIAKDEVEAHVKGKRVLVTGAGGSIGSELCRQIAAFGPNRLILYEQNENNLHHILLDLTSHFPGVPVVGVLADILDAKKVERVFNQHAPQMVFHAAAYKHVPLMEENPADAVRNNVMGTAQILQAAVRHRAESFVLISTDKAVYPTSIMGATKRIAEMIVHYFSSRVSTHLLTVRFGNVLESNGSVVPLFRNQIKQGGPVTVTHADVKRYFITIDEAVQLVLQAAVLGKGGEVFVLDMGEPYKVLDLAKTMITLSGFTPHLDIPIHFVGLRPGEKMVEELFEKSEEIKSTTHPKIAIAQNGKIAYDIPAYLAKLEAAIKQDLPPKEIRDLLKEIIPTATGL